MGKASKGRKAEKRKTDRRKMKAARKAEYASLAGTSKKRKKVTARERKLKKFSPGTHRHLMSHCGNPGCKKCGGIDVKASYIRVWLSPADKGRRQYLRRIYGRRRRKSTRNRY